MHELDADWDPPARSLDRVSNLDKILDRLTQVSGIVGQLAAAIARRCRDLTEEINPIAAQVERLAEKLAPALIAVVGCSPLTAAKILGEAASVARFRSAAAFARHKGTAPLPVWSSTVRATGSAVRATGSAEPETASSTQPCTASR
ncbi:transposase [Actinoplanes sp. CA-030573]|uniref:transposase n=1 Tax=Actinoplanes sp. CA-030573 TaxID=3239898 RepID=UPI003D8F6085